MNVVGLSSAGSPPAPSVTEEGLLFSPPYKRTSKTATAIFCRGTAQGIEGAR